MVGETETHDKGSGLSPRPRRKKSSSRIKKKIYNDFDFTEDENIPDVTQDPIFPESMSQMLKEEVNALKRENVRLKRALEESKSIENPVELLPSPLRGLGRSSDLAASKIVELSKKVRDLNAKLGSAQSKADTAEAQLSVYMASKASNEIKNDEPPELSILEQKENDIKELQEKINISNTKLCESRNQVTQLKHDLKMAQKALISEVGDEATVQSALAGNGNWRGRAQQIITLQQKINEFKASISTELIANEKFALSIAVSERHADKEKLNALNKEIEALKIELSDTKSKLDASKARIRVLANELSTNKNHLQTLNAKSSQDDQMISRLTNQLSGMMDKAKEREEAICLGLNEKISDLSINLSQEKAKSEQLREIIAEQEEKILKIERNEIRPGFVNRPSGDLVDVRPPSRASSFDQSVQSTVLQTSETERIRMMELVSVLNRRVEQERKCLDKVQDELRKERHRGVKLETKLARLEMEKVGCNRGSSGCYKSPSKSSQSSISSLEYENTKDKCALLQEKCLALETRLERLRQEKEDDARLYQNMLEETRQTIKDHIRYGRSSSTTSSLP